MSQTGVRLSSKIILIILTALVPVLTAGPSVAGPKTSVTPSTITWKDCGDSLQCANLDVPLNWRVPTAETIPVAMARWPAVDQTAKRGSLLVNLGGPGESRNAFRRTLEKFSGPHPVVAVRSLCPDHPTAP